MTSFVVNGRVAELRGSELLWSGIQYSYGDYSHDRFRVAWYRMPSGTILRRVVCDRQARLFPWIFGEKWLECWEEGTPYPDGRAAFIKYAEDTKMTEVNAAKALNVELEPL